MNRVRTPARPSTAKDILTMSLSVKDVFDPKSGKEILIPPIDFHVTPSSMQMSYTKNISRSRTRGGFVEEHFGDELDTIQISAATGSFLSIAKNGLTSENRNRTLSMVNFQEILAIYRNNACVYDQTGIVVSQGFVVLNWDNYRFNGQFSSFNWEESAESPFRFTFGFNFEVQRTTFQAVRS
jgi:hypothetical protein